MNAQVNDTIIDIENENDTDIVEVETNSETNENTISLSIKFAQLTGKAKEQFVELAGKEGITLYDSKNEEHRKIIEGKCIDVRYIQSFFFKPLHIMSLHMGGIQTFNSEKTLTLKMIEDKEVGIKVMKVAEYLEQVEAFTGDFNKDYYVPKFKMDTLYKPSTSLVEDEIEVSVFKFKNVEQYSADIRAYTDFKGIFIDAEFLLNLTKGEATFVSIHEILHNFLLHNIRTMQHPVFDKYKKMWDYYTGVMKRKKEGKLDNEYFKKPRWLNFMSAFEMEKGLVNMALDQPINSIILEEFNSIDSRKINVDRLTSANSKLKAYINASKEGSAESVEYPLSLLESFLGSFIYEDNIKHYTAEEAYDHFNKKYDKKQKKKLSEANIDVQSAGGGEDGEGKSKADYEGERKAREDLVRSIAERYKQIGGRSESINKWYTEWMAEKSKVDYRTILRNSIFDLFRSKPSWSRLHRQLVPHEIYRPASKGDHVVLNFICDTSGSMGGYIEHVFPEIEKIVRTFGSYELNFIAVDTDICANVKFSPRKQFKRELVQESLRGGGGTDYEVIWEHLAKTKNNAPVIFLTDFGVHLPEKKPVPNNVIWLAPKSAASYEWGVSSFTWGKIILIPDLADMQK